MDKKLSEIFEVDEMQKISDEVQNWVSKTAKYMEEKEYKSAITAYEDIQLYMWRRLLENTKNWFWRSSNEKYPLIANAWKTYSWMMSRLNLNKVIVSTYLPTGNEKLKSWIPVYKNACKYFLNKQETKSAVTEIIDEALAVGTSYWKVTWVTKKRKVVKKVSWYKWSDSKKVEFETIERWYPVIKYCSYFNVVRDLSNEWRYIWERYFASKSQINNDYKISAEDREKIEKWNTIFKYDYNKVKNISARDTEIKQKCWEVMSAQMRWSDWRASAKNLPKHDNWYWLDKSNWLYEIFDIYIEWWENTYNVVLINWYVVHAWESTLPFDWSPIIQLNFEKMPWETFGRWIWRMGRWYQSSVDTLYNSYLNSIKILTNPQFTQAETLTGNSKIFNYVPRWIVSTSSWADTLERIELVKSSDTQNNLQAIQTIEAKFSADLWLNPYVTGQSWWIERSAEWVRQRKLGTDNKVAKFLDNINAFFSKAVEQMCLLQMVFWEDIFDEVDGETVKLKNSDIVTWYKITFDWEDILWEKAAKTQEAINLLSAIAPFNIDEVTGEKVIDSRQLLTTVFENMDMYGMVKSNDEKLEHLDETITYMKSKQEKLAALQWKQDPRDKVNFSVSVSAKDIADMPWWREKLLQSIWLEVTPPEQQVQPQEMAWPVAQEEVPQAPWIPLNLM